MIQDRDDTGAGKSGRLIFLLDVDNTLLDNDRLKSDLRSRLLQVLGPAGDERFWRLYEEVREELDYVDYPSTVARYEKSLSDREVAARIAAVFDQIDFRS